MKRLVLTIAMSLGLAATPALAADETGFTQFRREEAVTIQPDKAYVLFRVPVAQNTVFLLRVPTPAELAAYDAAKRTVYAQKEREESFEEFVFDWVDGTPNFYGVWGGREYARPEKDFRVYLAEVPPGEYVVYGLGARNFIVQCNCLGSVSFPATAGEVTDLGTLLISPAAGPSSFPELAAETNLGRVARMDYSLFAFGIREAAEGDFIPAQINGARIVPASYRAEGPWVDLRRLLVNRLAEMPGVLEYREGIPYDPVSGQELRLSLPDAETESAN